MIRRAIWVAAALCLLVPATLNLHGGAQASRSPAAKVPIRAALSASTVHMGETLSVSVQTLTNAAILLHVRYSGGGGFKKKGKTGKQGRWTHQWAVHASSPGPGTAVVNISRGALKRHYT